MSWPAGVSLCSCTFGPDVSGVGTGLTIEASVSVVLPGAKRLVWTADGTSVTLKPERHMRADAGTSVAFQVPHVDQDGFTDGNGNPVKNWSYRIDYNLRGNGVIDNGNIAFAPTVGTATLDIDTQPDGATGMPAPIYAALPILLDTDGVPYVAIGA